MKMKYPLLLALVSASLLVSSCGTNAPTKAAQADQILITVVADGMQQWAAYVNAGKATQSQINTVKTAYTAYYTAQQVAKAVIEKAIAKDPTVTTGELSQANQAVKDAETALIAIVNQFIIH
jgi:hypothetical protein